MVIAYFIAATGSVIAQFRTELTTGRTPSHLLLFQEDIGISNKFIPPLISKIIDCNHQDDYGVTPLMLSTANGLDIVKEIAPCTMLH